MNALRSVRVTPNGALALVLAFAAVFAVYRTWGGVARPGLYHDEKAYLLQSRIYTDLRWTEPTPPIASLWEQVHVFTEPHYASRYPPGFPAVLAVGTAIGAPGVVPLACAALTAALLMLFGARLVGTWTAFAATALWLGARANIVWRASYFSESLTGLLWIAWSWCAWEYRRSGQRRFLVAASLLVAFAGITRPVTAIALSLPLGVILWPRIRTRAGVRDTLVAAGAGLVICAVVPIWNHAVLDSWKTLPYAEYSARTFPFDMPTWKTDWSAPPREIPPDFEALAAVQRVPYEQRTIEQAPKVFVTRTDRLGRAALPRPFVVLRALAPVGLLLAGGAGIAAIASALLLLLAHISMPHPPEWTIYYLDVFPVVAFGVVIALTRAGGWIVKRTRAAPLLSRAHYAGAFAGAALLVGGATSWRPTRTDEHAWMKSEVFFRAGLCALPAGNKIVFVHPRRDASPHHSLVDNDPRWQTSDAWIVRDWDAARNRSLLDAAPDRAAYFYDENAGWFARMNRDGTPTHTGVVNVLAVDLNTGRGISCR